MDLKKKKKKIFKALINDHWEYKDHFFNSFIIIERANSAACFQCTSTEGQGVELGLIQFLFACTRHLYKMLTVSRCWRR